MKLNKFQKQFLFENYYATAKVLDACVEPGWQNYFIKHFDWKLEDVQERWSGQKYGQLKLVDKEDKRVVYDYMVIFQGNDYFRLLKLAEKKA
ncbi:MAG: hypothetical protein J6Z11_02860 [Candidatus Riflebacteria bacterium]|nr:hypothetical protein [Candidatus Riflebacteria bacterium]